MKIALIIFVVVIAALMLAGAGGTARLLFPPGIIMLAGLLLWKRREIYVDVLLWCWFLCPFLRRVMDYQAGWKEPSLVLIVPYLIALLAPILGWKKIAAAPLKQHAAFAIALMAITYGTIVGITQEPLTAVAGAVLQWASPVAFAWWLCTADDHMQQLATRSIRRSFFWAVLVMGLYGIYQYVVAPAWDAYWLLQLAGSADVSSMGAPEPYGLRVFSTFNSAGAFALIMASGLLVVVDSGKKLRPAVFVAGALALLLTLGRSGWLALTLGLLLLSLSIPKQVVRTIAIPLVFILLFGSALSVGPAGVIVSDRLASLTRPSEDESGSDRTRGAAVGLQLIADHPQGYGLGVGVGLISNDGSFSLHDNGVIEGFLTLGLVGGTLYFGAIVSMLVRMFAPHRRTGIILTLPLIVFITFLSQIFLGSSNIGVLGFFFWMFAAWAVNEKSTAADADHAVLTQWSSVQEGAHFDQTPTSA